MVNGQTGTQKTFKVGGGGVHTLNLHAYFFPLKKKLPHKIWPSPVNHKSLQTVLKHKELRCDRERAHICCHADSFTDAKPSTYSLHPKLELELELELASKGSLAFLSLGRFC